MNSVASSCHQLLARLPGSLQCALDRPLFAVWIGPRPPVPRRVGVRVEVVDEPHDARAAHPASQFEAVLADDGARLVLDALDRPVNWHVPRVPLDGDATPAERKVPRPLVLGAPAAVPPDDLGLVELLPLAQAAPADGLHARVPQRMPVVALAVAEGRLLAADAAEPGRVPQAPTLGIDLGDLRRPRRPGEELAQVVDVVVERAATQAHHVVLLRDQVARERT